MRALTALRNNLSLSSIGVSFSQPDFWSVPQLLSGAPLGDRERIDNDFDSYAAEAFAANGIVFTVMLVRQFVLSEARFQFQRLENGRPGNLFGTRDLALLEQPWPNGTTGELIGRMEQDASLAGNFFATVDGTGDNRRLRRLRPDWVTIITAAPTRPNGSPGQPWDIGARVAGYLYSPSGDPDGSVLLTPDQVIHWSPIPDPQAQWRGMSWLTPILREIESDSAATDHKRKFFRNGALTNLIISYDSTVSRNTIADYAKVFAEQYSGSDNAYKTFHMGGGADPKMVGSSLQQLDFKATQGAGESRIAAAGLTGSVMAQFSEGMAGSSLNAGNFNAAKRRFADVGARPLWRSMAAALAPLIEVPSGSRLWYDDRDIPFLRDSAIEEADIQSKQAQTLRTLTDAGYTPQSAQDAITSGDLSRLQHSGLYSVQLQAPGAQSDGDDDGRAAVMDLAVTAQRIYLPVVNGVITAEEARGILNRIGAELPEELPDELVVQRVGEMAGQAPPPEE